jgi:hypothetical protein
MAEWLIEHKYPVYFLLAAAVVGSFALWWRTRKPYYLIALSVAAVLMVGMVALDQAVETDGEQMVRKVREVAAAVTAKDLTAAFQHVSESFNRGGHKKDEFRKFCESTVRAGRVDQVQVWNETVVDLSRPGKTGTVQFNFKVHGNWGETPPNWFAKVMFTLDPDGQWRVKSFDHFDSLNQSNTPLPIPGW